jgi:hypothetical protein
MLPTVVLSRGTLSHSKIKENFLRVRVGLARKKVEKELET